MWAYTSMLKHRHFVPLSSNCCASSRTVLPVDSLLSPFTKAVSDVWTMGPRGDLAAFLTPLPLACFFSSLLPSDILDHPEDGFEPVGSEGDELDSRRRLKRIAEARGLA